MTLLRRREDVARAHEELSVKRRGRGGEAIASSELVDNEVDEQDRDELDVRVCMLVARRKDRLREQREEGVAGVRGLLKVGAAGEECDDKDGVSMLAGTRRR